MRVVCLVADGFGVGALPDAAEYGDEGSNTLAHIASAVGGLKLPTLQRLGLGNLTAVPSIAPATLPLAITTRLAEKSKGKDTTTGHWEIAGLVTKKPFALFPNGFPSELIESFVSAARVPGVLGNRAASGTAIIEELGETHLSSGKPIVYTSGDSVFQIAAHEKAFGLERLYEICKIARQLTEPYQIGRVIARPFVGENSRTFKRTENRRDYALSPGKNCLDVLQDAGVAVCSVGKIEDIFAHRGLSACNHTGNNKDSLNATLDFMRKNRSQNAFIFTNLVDFDMLYGHRRDPKGYANALVEFDTFLPRLLEEMGPQDCLLITADHGCDPTFKGTDHTREWVPLLAYSPGITGVRLSDRTSFADVGATALDVLGVPPLGLKDIGESVLCKPKS